MDVLAQIIMALTLVLMLIGKTPLYSTAIVGATLSALVYGLPIRGDSDVAIVNLVAGGLNPVIADMAGVLIFIGAMEYAGFLHVLVKAMIRVGNRIGGGPGVATMGGIGAGIIGGFTGFTQPAITAVVTGPASVRLGADPNQSAGTHAHAGHLGNFAGFTHPTLLAVMALVGIKFGAINVVGLVTGLSIFAVSFIRMRRSVRKSGAQIPAEDRAQAMGDFQRVDGEKSVWFVLLPFVLLVIGFSLGYPVFLVGFLVSILVMVMGRCHPVAAEAAMLDSAKRIAVPLVATVGFLYMSSVIDAIGITDLLSDWFKPLFIAMPIMSIAIISALAGLLTQSNSASAAIILPTVRLMMAMNGVAISISPLALAVAACGPAAIMQFFLTGGPVAALATTIPVVPGSDLRRANRFQRPAQLFGLVVVVVIALLINHFA
ncbi:hypothetical protein [Trueperella sp. LYQ143]|uniref:hypothetical protein n=1 Tax=unclassified Trueperella TaxID=2630174 RepID=UPI0039834CCA